MKKSIITTLFLFFWGFINAQCLINNGTLNSSCIGDGYNTSSPCVANWIASHGTPTAMGAVNGNTWAWMWSYGNTGEGIMTNYNFQVGQNYQISFRIRATTNISNPNSTVLNSTVLVRATSGLTSTNSTSIPTPSNVQTIWSDTVGNVGTAWRTISIPYSPSNNYSQLWLYPLMEASSASNGFAQIQMEVDDIAISPIVTASLFFQDATGTRKSDFCAGETIFMNGTNSLNETQYYIDVWRRPIGSTTGFQWQTQLGSNGWTNGQVGVLNLSALFAAQNYTFAEGFEYQVKLATANACFPWVEATRTFRVHANNSSPAFTYTTLCATNGTIRVTATAANTTPGISHSWMLMETSAPGNTSDAATLGQIGNTLSGTTVTFSGLSHTKNYYIKHGIYGYCLPWREQRTALPQNTTWNNYTTNFDIAPSGHLNGTVTVTAVANSNSVYVNHHWSIYLAPNGITTGNTSVPGNPDQCCTSDTATFTSNLIVNEWYYIKHGIWNDCMSWNETRKAFRVVVQGLKVNGTPNYVVEETLIDEKTKAKQVNEPIAQEETVLYPNPIARGEILSITKTNKDIIDTQLIDFMGTTRKLPFSKTTNAFEMTMGTQLKTGIYTLKLTCSDGSILTKKVIVK